jgi:hypothetical protein|nr:MAG TPA: hypothetical protein [Bacteriophage sp.]DAW99028.1 MAG TPA: hypothetical protein [Bacteriophage sp.]
MIKIYQKDVKRQKNIKKCPKNNKKPLAISKK